MSIEKIHLRKIVHLNIFMQHGIKEGKTFKNTTFPFQINSRICFNSNSKEDFISNSKSMNTWNESKETYMHLFVLCSKIKATDVGYRLYEQFDP